MILALLFMFAASVQQPVSYPEATKVECSAGRPIERPEVWDVMLRYDLPDSKHVVEFHSEHTSRDKALKECSKVLAVRDKWFAKLAKQQKGSH